MRDVLFLAWRYLVYHRLKTAILVTSIMLIIYLPVGLNVVVEQSGEHLTARAEATPLLIGAKGSPLELALNSLYFSTDVPELIDYADAGAVAETELANPIPLYVRFRSRSQPIVGTSLDYFDFQDLRFAAGRPMAVLGECVVGAAAAEALGVGVGDTVISSPETVFDLAGIYPLKMTVSGVLEKAFTPDDEAIFVDVKTTWIIQGLGHGHQDLADPGAASNVLRRTEDSIIANAALMQYNEITADNADSFHFHGDLSGYPLTAVIAVPGDEKSGVLLRGRYTDAADTQIVRPLTVIDELLDTILTIQQFIVAAVIIVGLATIATAALVFLLSLRLRRREIDTMLKIGGSRPRVAAMLLAEVVIVLVLSGVLATAITLLTWRFGPGVIESLVIA